MQTMLSQRHSVKESSSKTILLPAVSDLLWLKHIAGFEYGYGLENGFQSYAEIGSRDPSPRLCNDCQCEHVLHGTM